MAKYKHRTCPVTSADRTQKVDGLDAPNWLAFYSMDYKREIGRRIKKAREAKVRKDGKNWSLEDLSKAAKGLLSKSRIGNYEQGVREPGSREATILADALGVSSAWLMCLEDDMDREETEFFRNWKALPENERRAFARRIAALALAYREALPDERLGHLPPVPKTAKAKKSAKS